jgi:hypothetical protein
MVDTIRTLSALQALLGDNTAGDISAQDIRDLLVSAMGGFGAYDDLATKTTPLAFVAGVRKSLECDAGGPNGNTDFLPYPKTKVTDELWDATNDRVLLANLPVGARISVRVDFVITPASPNTELDLFFEFHNSSDVKIFELDISLAEIKAATAHGEVILSDFFVGSVIQDGYVYLNLLSSNNADVEVGGLYINVWR